MSYKDHYTEKLNWILAQKAIVQKVVCLLTKKDYVGEEKYGGLPYQRYTQQIGIELSTKVLGFEIVLPSDMSYHPEVNARSVPSDYVVRIPVEYNAQRTRALYTRHCIDYDFKWFVSLITDQDEKEAITVELRLYIAP